MSTMKYIIDLFLHVDKNLAMVIESFGLWSYGILFLVLFCETGLVIMPFLPGDSLLFAAGALTASLKVFNIWWLWGLMVLAAFVGDTVNYWIGHSIGKKAFDPNFQFSIFNFQIKLTKVLKPEYLHKAQAFYEKHGGKAIVLARFVPIVRTFAPFVAGVGEMSYVRFITYNFWGGVLWVSLFTGAGYFFGNIPVIAHNFHYVVLGIVVVSVVPIIMEVVKGRREK
ncbi:DedA family protein [Candidatus Shapirobacteria bacterium]|nr:DedA family protein [Candidatus Shapirobacteria bacterium]